MIPKLITLSSELVDQLLKRFVMCFGLSRAVPRELSWRWFSLNYLSKLFPSGAQKQSDTINSQTDSDSTSQAETFYQFLVKRLIQGMKDLNFCCVRIFALKSEQDIPAILDRVMLNLIKDVLWAENINQKLYQVHKNMLPTLICKYLVNFGYKVGFD